MTERRAFPTFSSAVQLLSNENGQLQYAEQTSTTYEAPYAPHIGPNEYVVKLQANYTPETQFAFLGIEF